MNRIILGSLFSTYIVGSHVIVYIIYLIQSILAYMYDYI